MNTTRGRRRARLSAFFRSGRNSSTPATSTKVPPKSSAGDKNSPAISAAEATLTTTSEIIKIPTRAGSSFVVAQSSPTIDSAHQRTAQQTTQKATVPKSGSAAISGNGATSGAKINPPPNAPTANKNVLSAGPAVALTLIPIEATAQHTPLASPSHSPKPRGKGTCPSAPNIRTSPAIPANKAKTRPRVIGQPIR